ncbi:hypothetical protein K438DRAFT_1813986 [Mycena galopus ATCC 62051]|nr:hypothetical protein K438DRAFT_1813986 [Mycena galopus ATCC 62051]
MPHPTSSQRTVSMIWLLITISLSARAQRLRADSMYESPSAGTRAADGRGTKADAAQVLRSLVGAEVKKGDLAIDLALSMITVCVDACPRRNEYDGEAARLREASAGGSARASKEVPISGCRLYGAECRTWSDHCAIVLGSRARREYGETRGKAHRGDPRVILAGAGTRG